MVSGKDIGLLLTFAGIAGVAVFVVGGAALPGSNTFQDIISQPDNTEETRYELTTKITANTGGLAESTFKYKTSKDQNLFFSISDPGKLSLFTGARDFRVEYILRDTSGRIVASDVKNLGSIDAFTTKDVTFESGNLVSGTYSVTYVANYEKCFVDLCSRRTDKISKTVSVPKLPLGEY